MVRGRIIVAGSAQGELLRLSAPISFWGGVEPTSGRIADTRHPEHGVCISGRVLAIPATVGSSSSSAIMLELIRENTAPAALLLGTADAIVALGVVVAVELGLGTVPVLEIPWQQILDLPAGQVDVAEDGTVRAAGAA
jgi:predicted aconitase with swiveling domain